MLSEGMQQAWCVNRGDGEAGMARIRHGGLVKYRTHLATRVETPCNQPRLIITQLVAQPVPMP